MPSCTSGKWLRLPVGALLALLACTFVAPTKARAGCSRYVTHPSSHERLLDMLGPGPDDRGAEATRMPAPARRLPCSGPSCSENTPSPTAPSVDFARFIEPWAHLGFGLVMSGLDSSALESAPDDLRSLLAMTAIFHPPRA